LRLVWQSQARAELREAVRFYRDNAGYSIARDFRDAAVHTAERLSEHPEIGPRIDHNARRINLHDYPYSLIYRFEPSSIIVIALAHQSRRPGYWVGRR
jgi:toxin ParE1/3/4